MNSLLLAECLKALNAAPRFNYGTRSARGYSKPDSYDLAARIDAYQLEQSAHEVRERDISARLGCNVFGRLDRAALEFRAGNFAAAVAELHDVLQFAEGSVEETGHAFDNMATQLQTARDLLEDSADALNELHTSGGDFTYSTREGGECESMDLLARIQEWESAQS